MTNEEAKRALMDRGAVISCGIEYACINAIIYRRSKLGNIFIQAELLDKCGTSVTITNIKDVELKGVKNESKT